VQHLTVLSPYHDRDGCAVHELVQQTGAQGLRIGLPPPPHLSSFPFPIAAHWQVPLSAVKVDLNGDKRYIHAKWMEWKTEKGVFALTGSVNATSQALLKTNNIEVGIVRLDRAGKGWTKWKRFAIPDQYQEMNYRPPGLLNSYLVYAELRGTGELQGRIISTRSAEGSWAGVLQKASGESVSFCANVTEDGCFETSLAELEDFAFSPALQLAMTSGALIARGWVQNTEILGMPRLRKLGISSLLRLINREETADDDIALLDYLAIHATEHLATFQRAMRRGSDSTRDREATDDRVMVHVADLAPVEESKYTSHDETVLGMTPVSALERIFSQLRRRLLGAGTPEKETTRANAVEADSEDATPDGEIGQGEAHEQRRVQRALDYFDEKMRELVDADGVDPAKVNSLLVLWLEVTLHMLLRRQSDRAAALAFLRSWFQKAAQKCHPADDIDAVEQHLTAAAVVLRCVASDSAACCQIHEALEDFWDGSVPAERAARSLLGDSRIGLGGILLDLSTGQLKAALDEILATTTIRQEIEQIIAAHRQDTPLPASPILETEAGKALRRELLRRGGKVHITEVSGTGAVCPNCYCGFCSSVAASLRVSRLAVCTSCGWIILRVKP
jgi:hypothetical protein